ncbi:MAG: HAD-IB family phosphatase, partial [Clostridium sp.]
MKSKFAIFDVDYTIINGDSMLLMLLFGIKKRPLIILYSPIILVKTVLSLLGIIDKRIAKDSINIPLKYLNEKEMEQFYNDVLLKKINIEVMKCLKQHKENGYYVLLASASAQSYLRYFSEHEYIDVVIGTRVNKINNKIEGENCKG